MLKFDTRLLSEISTPFYLYDKNSIEKQYEQLAGMDNAFGLEIAYALKASPNTHILKTFKKLGAKIDASSFNEVKRALNAGFGARDISYTTQQILKKSRLNELKELVKSGLKFNVCSLRQFDVIKDLVKENNIKLCVRVHPGKGAGQSNSRNTGDQYSCFGVHLKDIPTLLERAHEENIVFDQIHIHVGSGGKVSAWKDHIVQQMDICRKYFKGITLNKINFGGGFKVARMPSQETVDVKAIGEILKTEVENYGKQTQTQPITVVQSGTFLMANSGYVVTSVLDIKKTQKFQFLILDGGMEVNTRPLLYGSRHPFYLYSEKGVLKSSQWQQQGKKKQYVVVGRCCQSGDSQTLQAIEHVESEGHSHSDKFKIAPRSMGIVEVGDLLVIGGAGAYCSAMTLNNYNSHFIPAEYLITKDKSLVMIREEQTFEQIIQNQVKGDLDL